MFDENGEHIPEDPWSSVVDLMSALVLVLFLAVIFFITNYSEVSEELAAEQRILEQRSADLKKTRQSLVSAQESNVDLIAEGKKLSAETERLNAERVKLIADKDQLTQDRKRLIGNKTNLEIRQAQLEADQARLINERKQLIRERKQLIGDRAELMADKKNLIGDKRLLSSETERLNAKVVRLQAALQEAQERQSSLMDSLASSLQEAKAEGVSVDKEGGKIILKSEVLFSRGDTQLTTAGKRSIASVSRGLLRVLKNPKLRAIVDGVMIEGHASSSGALEKNLRLSADRSLNTLSHLLSLPTFQGSNQDLQRLFFAGAFGESRPILNAHKREDKIKSRRIEIRVLFNQSQLNSLAHDITQ